MDIEYWNSREAPARNNNRFPRISRRGDQKFAWNLAREGRISVILVAFRDILREPSTPSCTPCTDSPARQHVLHHLRRLHRLRTGLYIARASKRVETRGGRIGLTRANRSAAPRRRRRRRPLSNPRRRLQRRVRATRKRARDSTRRESIGNSVVVVVVGVESREEGWENAGRKDETSSGRFSPRFAGRQITLAVEESARFSSWNRRSWETMKSTRNVEIRRPINRLATGVRIIEIGALTD